MSRSPYPAVRVPVDHTPALPGAPRIRRAAPITAMRRPDTLRDTLTLTPVNGAAPVWGPSFRAVTGRKALKRPGWQSVIAGGRSV